MKTYPALKELIQNTINTLLPTIYKTIDEATKDTNADNEPQLFYIICLHLLTELLAKEIAYQLIQNFQKPLATILSENPLISLSENPLISQIKNLLNILDNNLEKEIKDYFYKVNEKEIK